MRKIKGEKMEEVCSLEPNKIMYPSFGISIEHLPEAKKWSIGDVYYVTLELKQTGIDVHKYKGEEERGHASFDILGVEVLKKKPEGKYKELPDLE